MDTYQRPEPPTLTAHRPPLLTTDGLSARTGLPPRLIRRRVSERAIPHLKIGAKLLFDLDEVEAWLEAQRVPTRPPSASRPAVRRTAKAVKV